MAITYPIDLPDSPGFSSVSLSSVNVIAKSESIYSFKQQVVAHPGERWQLDCVLPPMGRSQAEAWLAALTSLRGPFGTFILGLPDTARAAGRIAGLGAQTVTVDGADQTGRTLDVNVVDAGNNAAQADVTELWAAGDYIQLGAGANARLYKILSRADTDSSGDVSLDIWPALRSSPADGAAVVYSNCQALWRLSTPINWTVDYLSHYSVSFGAVEAL